MNRFPVPFRFVALILLSGLIVVIGLLNVRDRVRWTEPADGVFWEEDSAGVRAREVFRGGPGALAGIRPGDHLGAMAGKPVRHLGDYAEILYGLTPGQTVDYSISAEGGGSPRHVDVTVGSRPLFSAVDGLRLVLAFVHLAVGLWVVFRAGRVPRAQHFFWICLSAFVVYLFRYTTRLDALDWIVYGLSVAFFLLLPAIFVHFSLRFPLEGAGAGSFLAYMPAVVLGVIQVAWMGGHLAGLGFPLDARSSQLLERVHLVYMCAGFVLGGLILLRRRRCAGDWVAEQQMRWISYGTLAGIVPFGLLYGLPFLFGARPGFGLSASILFLALVPLSFAHAVLRYRLGDVEVIVRRGAAYFLASSLLLAFYLFLVLVIGRSLERLVPEADFLVITGAALAVALLFAPLRNRIQERLDRIFFKDRFQDRSTLQEFARMLTTQVSLPVLSRSILERIERAFDVPRVALFLSDPSHRGFFRLSESLGLDAAACGSRLWRAEEIEETTAPKESGTDSRLRRANPELRTCGLHHVQDLRVRGRRIGLIALGSSHASHEFSHEDAGLLSALAGYAAIAIDNASLYLSVENKARELESLRQYTENILESINVAVLVLDAGGRVRSCNRAFEELYGASRDEARGLEVEQVFGGDVVSSMREAAGSTGWEITSPSYIYKLFLENRRGRRLIVNVGLIPMLESLDPSTGCLIVMDDITEKVQLQDQLLQAEKLSSLGLLAAGVAHEVNTPISGISSYTQMLLRETPDGDTRKSILEKIERQTFRAAEIVNGLLNFSRMNGSEFADLDLNQIIRETLSLVNHQMRQSHVRIAAHLDERLPRVYGNAGKLQQVFLNLFMNARDAMPSGGDLEIRTSMNDTMAVVEVRDTGVGISRDDIKRIYDPFFTTKTTGKGTGLGLAVTYGILQDHGGRISVDSEPGQGTRFTIKLPTRASSQQ